MPPLYKLYSGKKTLKYCYSDEELEDAKKEFNKENECRLLKAFRDCCDSKGLRYYLCNGTLLGAIKYNGFIPWDDDIDVCLPREDYSSEDVIIDDNSEKVIIDDDKKEKNEDEKAVVSDNDNVEKNNKDTNTKEENQENKNNTKVNPKTGVNFNVLFIVILLISTVLLYIKNKKSKFI